MTMGYSIITADKIMC